MKIVGDNGGFTDGKDLDSIGFHWNHVVYILKAAFDQQESASHDREAILVKDVGRDDRVRDSGFIFETEEHESFSSARTLACNDSSGNSNGCPVTAACQIGGP